mmetsp:Transcript_11708/g.1804  ORF Transcript_11708/g.1804 Transcript_11708/m.1804 type:complete len:88 (+) Transcript_11708:46-309(+)
MKVILSLIVALAVFTTQVSANCMEKAQSFKCTYNMLQCTDGDNGKCECEDKSTCTWTDGVGDENCPCGANKGGSGPRRKRRRIHSDM